MFKSVVMQTDREQPGAPSTWWFTVACLVLVAALRLHTLDFPLERDEGEYAYAGQLMLQGIPPYQLAYNMKLPGTYAAYAVMMAVFGQTPAAIHFGILLVTTTTALMLYWLGKQMLDTTMGMASATAYAVLAVSPWMFGLAGHATHFCAFFVTAGLCVTWRARLNRDRWPGFAAGLLFGAAVLMKQHAAVIALWATIAWTVSSLRCHDSTFGTRLARITIFAAGLLLPYALCCFWLWQAGVFEKFWFWTVDYAREYETINPVARNWHGILELFPEKAWPGVLVWVFAGAGAVAACWDHKLRPARWWLLGFAVASTLAVFPGFYFRQNYFLIMLPATALLAGAAVSLAIGFCQRHAAALAGSRGRLVLVMVYGIVLAARLWDTRAVWFAPSAAEASRFMYALEPFPEAEKAASFIQGQSTSKEQLAVLGSEPEIYFLAKRRSATGYIYTFGMAEPQRFARRMQEEMIHETETGKPEWVVFTRTLLEWRRCPEVDPLLLDWWEAYKTNYNLVGIADIVSLTNTVYSFDPAGLTNYPRPHGLALEVHRRKCVTEQPELALDQLRTRRHNGNRD